MILKPICRSVLVFWLGSTMAMAQEQPLPILVESVDVRVINVDVVVTDRKGNAIPGLKIGDFEVYENGRPMKLTNFYEVAGNRTIESPQAPIQTKTQTPPGLPAARQSEQLPENLQRRIVFFIDNLSLHPFNRNKVFESMKTFARESMRPGDEAMVATWNRSMKIRVPFTKDHVNIQQALEGIAGESAFGVHNISERRQVEGQIREARTQSEAVGAARQYAQSVEHDLRQSVAAVNGLMATLAGVEGKKILVMTSEGFPMQPGRELFFFIDDIAKEKRNWGGGGSSLIESMSFDATHLIQSIARTANANGITLYTLHAGGLVGGNEMSAENAKPLSFTAQQQAISNSTDSLNLLANMTGGKATVGTNNFKMGFDQIQRDLNGYYSLGYRAGTERVDRQRTVDVRLKNNNKKYIVRSRKSFVEKSVETEMSDRVIANLFYEGKANDLKIFLTTKQPIPTENGLFKIPVEVHIPMENLSLIPQGELHIGGFTVFVAAADKNGDMSEVSRQNHRLKVPQAEMPKTSGKFYTYALELLMEKGRNKVSVGVVDEISKMTGFQRTDILAADLR